MSDHLYEQLNLDVMPGFCISKLGEMMRSEYVSPNSFVSLTEIACEKQVRAPSYLILGLVAKQKYNGLFENVGESA